MEILKTTSLKEAEEYALECLTSHEGLIIHESKSIGIMTGKCASTINLGTCQNNELEVVHGYYYGGTIVNMIGDISLCLTTWGASDYAPKMIDTFCDYLDTRNISWIKDKNDVLIEGKKVLSWDRAIYRTGYCQSVVHFSVGIIDLPLIQQICNKPMIKIPGSLLDYDITKDDVIDFVNGYNEIYLDMK